jgi:hypothetical protein
MSDIFSLIPGAAVVGPVLGAFVWVPAVILVLYVIARWRSYREDARDTQLGLKVALSFFKLASYQISLAGIFLLVYALMSDAPDETQERILRMAGGLLVPGLLIYAVHFYAYNHTNHRELPTVDRLFAGVNLLQTGMIGFVSWLVSCVFLFQESVPDEIERLSWSLVIVYSLAWIVQGLLFARQSTIVRTPPPGRLSADSTRP